MELKIVEIKDKGNIEKERIVLKATKRTELGLYLIILGRNDQEEETIIPKKHFFWFPEKVVDANEPVVLYTKTGVEKSVFYNSTNRYSHFFYLELKTPAFSHSNDGAILIQIKDWISV